jgi:hypothetical protein
MHQLSLSEDAKQQLNRIAHRALACTAWGREPEVIDSLRSAVMVLNQVIQLGGELTGPPIDSPETMVINGWTGYLQYGVVEHKAIFPEVVEDWAKDNDYNPKCYEYGIHS